MHVPEDLMWRRILKSFWFLDELNKALVVVEASRPSQGEGVVAIVIEVREDSGGERGEGKDIVAAGAV